MFTAFFIFFYFFVHCTEQGTHFRLFSEYPFQEKFCLQNEERVSGFSGLASFLLSV